MVLLYLFDVGLGMHNIARIETPESGIILPGFGEDLQF
jgi:hypothetical protein